MDDITFCTEYVKRIDNSKGYTTKINREMTEIVINGKSIDVATMFNNKAIEGLHSSDQVGAFVYKFVRDNQELFCKPTIKLKM